MTDSPASDHFSLFGLARSPHVDTADLAQRYRRLQQQVHPDRFAGAAAFERQVALQQASRINDAYAVLKNPLARAAYLLSLFGADVYAETDTAVPVDFLEQQMEWREALMEAEEAEDATARDALRREIAAARDDTAAAAAAALTALLEGAGGGDTADTADTAVAYDIVRRWTYLEKLLPAEAH